MIENPYARWMAEDNENCFPVLDRDNLLAVLAEVRSRVFRIAGDGPDPASTSLDLEQLQVTDYARLNGVSEGQTAKIQSFQREWPVRAEDMLILSLRSLFQFAWPAPQTEEDIRYAAIFDAVLNKVLIARAITLSDRFSSPDGLLPYWGRLAFLREMASLPAENVSRFGLDKIAVSLVKNAKFNATTWSFGEGSVITLNYALEPILKQLNRYLLHYYSTRDMSGPMRLPRAWNGIVPIVLSFWSDVSATRIVRPSMPVYGNDMAVLMHGLTSDQVAFIVGHELGHVALDHPKRYLPEGTQAISQAFVMSSSSLPTFSLLHS